MDTEKKNKIALFRYGFIAEIISGVYKNVNKAEYFRQKGSVKCIDPYGKEITVSPTTLERWYYSYKKYGFDGLLPRDRTDCGRSRKIDGEVIEIINHYVRNYPRMPATAIYEALINNGDITFDQISPSTFGRYVRVAKNNNDVISHTEMKRYEAEHINDIWCCDTTYSFKLTVNGEKKRMYIMAIIDDASRMIVGCDVFFNDNYANFLKVLKNAIKKYGKPKILNLDNGAPYKNNQLDLLAARVGLSLFHNRPYYGQGKAKIERWFLTMKNQFMASYHLTSKTTIEEFKDDLFKYVNNYNNTKHSSINMTPINRFFDSGDEIIRLTNDSLEKDFLLELERKTSADCVIQIDNIEFEVPQKYSNKRIKIRYSSDYQECYVVNSDNTLSKITLLDKKANCKIKRTQPIFNTKAGQ